MGERRLRRETVKGFPLFVSGEARAERERRDSERRPLRPMMSREVLAQEILAVVVAVRRAEHSMDVKLLRLVVVEEHTLVHVELDQ